MGLSFLLRAVAETAKISLPTVVDARLGRLDADVCDERLGSWARALIQQAEVKLDVFGAIPEREAYLVMSNHQSLYDIPVLFVALPFPLRMAAKAELFRIPLWGRAMAESGFVRIDRARGHQARDLLMKAAAKLRASRRSLWVAPEGTRSRDGKLLPFKSGGFDIARDLGLPILPVTLQGTRSILGKNARDVTLGCTASVHVHEIIRPEDFPKDRDELRDLVRAKIASPLGE